MNSFLRKVASGRPTAARRWRRVAWAGLLALGLLGCAAPMMMPAGVSALMAHPNPSTDGAYTVAWPQVTGATKYRLFEDGKLAFEGFSLSHAITGKPDGAYAYSLTYCIEAFGIEVCHLRPMQAEVTVVVAHPKRAAGPPGEETR